MPRQPAREGLQLSVELDRTATAPAAPVASAALREGSRLGHFRIERKLGAGGMGEVYLATDLALDRPVAIKVLPDAVARDGARRDRMVNEARAQAKISHSNVAHIYFIGEDEGRLYFAMELVSGRTLAEKLAVGPLPADEALALIRAAVLGVREAQRNGFTHRDVKPSNLMVDAHGVVKVLDFGLAAGAGPDGGPVDQTSMAGTPLYMAPEQARGEPVDFRADIYALGATLFHLASGKPPFEAESLDALVSLHATAVRPTVPRHGRPRVQIGALERLCAKMMAPRAEERFASYDELLRAIDLTSASQTRPAGLWVRAIATLIDLAIVGILVGITDALVTFPGGALTFPLLGVYQTFAVKRWGQTLGKALFELEVVDIDTFARPGWSRAARRALAENGPIALVLGGLYLVQESGIYVSSELASLAVVLLVLLGGFSLIHASLRVSGKRTPWDRASKTLVRYRR